MDKMNTQIVSLSVMCLCLSGFAVTQAIITLGAHSNDLSGDKRPSLLTMSFKTKTKQESGAGEGCLPRPGLVELLRCLHGWACERHVFSFMGKSEVFSYGVRAF